MQLQFGNFIEKLISLVVERDAYVSALSVSGKRVPLSMRGETDSLIDQYITSRQLPNSPDTCDGLFAALLRDIIHLETQKAASKQRVTKDIDALFKTPNGQVIFLEIKYNEDHDTGKFVDINRKFIKTYAGLVDLIKITDPSALKPILYYFNPVKRWGPIYTPSSHIYRGAQLFDEYFETRFYDIDAYP